MTGEAISKNSDYRTAIDKNKQRVEKLIKDYATPTFVGMCSLDLIEAETQRSTYAIDKCDEVNRNMLDGLYGQLGVDIDNPTIVSRERFRPHHILYRAVLYELGNGIAIRESQITTNSRSSFHVDVGYGLII